MIVVADASAIAAFLLPDEAGPFAGFARQTCAHEQLCLPPHWRVEIASVIWKAKRRKRLADGDVDAVIASAEAIASFAEFGPQESVADVLNAAFRFGLTVYDAAYLVLARRIGGSLLSTDGDLCDAAVASNVPVLAP